MFGSGGAEVPTPLGPSVGAEGIGLGGYDTNTGFYAGGIGAAGASFELGPGGVHVYRGYERTTNSCTGNGITLGDVGLGPNIRILGLQGGVGGWVTDKGEYGPYFYVQGHLFGGEVSGGFGFSLNEAVNWIRSFF